MTTISALPAAAALDGAELLPVVQGGATAKSTTGDVVDLVAPSIDGLPASPNADDHEFDSGLGSFVAHTGTAGTITLTSASGNGVYQITDGALLAYPNSASNVFLRLDRTLADGESVVGKFLMASSIGEFRASGFVLNDLDSDPNSTTTANRISLWFDPQHTRVILYDGGGSAGIKTIYEMVGALYLRFVRVGTNYHAFYSYDGVSWRYVGYVTSATAPTNIWLYFRSDGGATLPAGEVTGVEWVRFGTTAVHPWPYTATKG